jgi:hypothetical protein
MQNKQIKVGKNILNKKLLACGIEGVLTNVQNNIV